MTTSLHVPPEWRYIKLAGEGGMLDEFAEYIARQWGDEATPVCAAAPSADSALPARVEGRPWHWYPHSGSRHWRQWIDGGTATRSLAHPSVTREKVWWCHSLGEASLHYSWPESEMTFDELGRLLRIFMKMGEVRAVAAMCRLIFRWGGVGRRANDQSRLWVTEHEDKSDLIELISEAVQLLQPRRAVHPDLAQRFNGPLLMNSAMTKVYAAADPNGQVMMYDSRVGAALCILLRGFGDYRRQLGSPVPLPRPSDLEFLWGPKPNQPAHEQPARDASRGTFVVHNMNGLLDSVRAEVSWRANVLAQKVKQRIRGVQIDVRTLEKGLFMVGYDVRQHPLPPTAPPTIHAAMTLV